MDVKAVRARFPIFERLTYVNSCSQGALSDAVRRSYEDYLRDWDEKGAPWEYWVERSETARAAFAGLINAEPDEIAVTTSNSAGVAALASGLRFAARSKVVLTDIEFPTIGQIWHAQEARGARVAHVRPDEVDSAVDEDTLLVSTTHVSYRTGEKVDVSEVARVAHELGALVLLDAYQTVGSMPVDVKELDVDFLAAGVLKYLLGSAGLAFFYCRRELWERAWPTATGWFADEDIFAMDIYDYSPSPTARRFQSGTPPVPSIYAGHRRDRADAGDRDRGDAGACERAQRAADRGRGRARRHADDASGSGSAGRADLHQVDRRERIGRSTRSARSHHL